MSANSTNRKTRLILTGGGTSGHVNPALAMGRAFESKLESTEILYVGVKGRAEEKIVPKAGIEISFVQASGYVSPGNPFGFLKFALKLGLGFLKSIRILTGFKPDYILATGGYVSAPLVLAQSFLKKLRLSKARVILHEANAVPGKLNNLMADHVDHLFLTFAQSQNGLEHGRAMVVGYPVRQALDRLDRDRARRSLGLDLDPETKLVLIFGGSQGALTINRSVIEALKKIKDSKQSLFILHGVGLGGSSYDPLTDTDRLLKDEFGPDWESKLSGFYRRVVYLHDMASAYSAADLVVCRAGAGAIHEISSLGRPALLIPKPNLPGDHQVQNARALASQGGAEILFEDLLLQNGRLLDGVRGSELADRIEALLENPERLREMGRRAGAFMSDGAADRIAEAVLNPGSVIPNTPEPRLLPPTPTHQGLLKLLTRAFLANPEGYDPTQTISDPEERDFYLHRSALLLLHPDWPVRNIGVKLLGLLKAESKIPHLMQILNDTSPTTRLKRMLGGDYHQVGFIRRNAITGLVLIGIHSPALEESLLAALKDPYFEVRSKSAEALATFGPSLVDLERVENELILLLADPSFEVVREAVVALGRIGRSSRVIQALLGLRLNRYWQVRQAALSAITELAGNDRVPDPERLLQEVTGFVVTATDFRPHFSIKTAYSELIATLRSKAEEG